MTEREKQLLGFPYDVTDPEVRRFQTEGKQWMMVYNALPPERYDEKKTVLKKLLKACGSETKINQPFWCDFGTNISIGSHCVINLNCTILDTGPVKIGDFTLLGPDVKIYTAVHPIEAEERHRVYGDGCQRLTTATKAVKIGKHVWIGGGTVILPGVTIGDGTVIGAGSVVTEDIPQGVVAYGNPCRVKREIKQKEKKMEERELFPRGEQNPFGEFFVGQSYLKMLTTEGVSIGNVTFEPGCRNNWHIHKATAGGGQILLCTSGRGWYQEWGRPARALYPGDVVVIPANVKHWHGAAKDSWFVHLAVEVPGEDTASEWLEPVDEMQYDQLPEVK